MPRGETVGIVRAATSGTDSTGESKPGADTTTSITGCAVWFTGSDEPDVVGGDPVITHAVVKFPTGTDVRPGDRLSIRGVATYKVDGEPADWRSYYTRRRPGIVVKAKKVTTNGG